uniref:CHD subfamily II SANT-like domain-containing protein n=1 Tax=Ditylenchus dipsaci TaxID=166011 RepID=A0A915EBV8_9BILA
MSKTELDDVLRWGTEELFKDNEQEAEAKANEQAIVWDDKAVDALLERNTEPEPAPLAANGEKKEHWTNEYLSSFKVATYVTENAQEEEEPEDETEVIKEATEEADPDYWEKLLRHHYEQDVETKQQNFGKGKRIRKQVNYASENMQQDWAAAQNNNQANDPEYSDSYSGESDKEGSGTGDDEFNDSGARDERKKKHRERNDEKLPPLLARVNGQLEVLGFNPVKEGHFTMLLCAGECPLQMLISHTYTSLFMRHLCEPGADTTEAFNDGVPREGLNRQHVLTRIGIMSLIRKKVQEFETVNGEWSMPEVKEQLIAAAEAMHNQAGTKDKSSSRDATPAAKDNGVEPKTDKVEKNGTKTGSGDVEMVDAAAVPPESTDEAETAKQESSPASSDSKPVAENGTDKENQQDETGAKKKAVKKTNRPKFMFNIADGGFTELHTLWINEEKAAVPNNEFEIWHRRHDYWLLCGIVVHGYGRYQDVQNEARFSVINEPFKSEMGKSNYAEIKNKFLQRRFKLLEQALKAEEAKEDSATGSLSTAGQVLDANGKDITGQLNERFADLECLADSHQSLARDTLQGNKNSHAVLHKVLTQLEDLLNDMKGDVSRLPATLARLRPVTERLGMTERAILSRLTSKDPEATAGKSPLPPPGPFVTPTASVRFSGIQPKFAALTKKDERAKTKASPAPKEATPAVEQAAKEATNTDSDATKPASSEEAAGSSEKTEEPAKETSLEPKKTTPEAEDVDMEAVDSAAPSSSVVPEKEAESMETDATEEKSQE